MEQIPLRHRFHQKHWLCKQLNDTAKLLDPEKYRKLIGESTCQGLILLGVPKYMANVLGAGAGFGLKIVIGQMPIGQLLEAMRVLIALACPDLSKCPAEGKVFSTFMSPLLTDTLKSIAEGGSLSRND